MEELAGISTTGFVFQSKDASFKDGKIEINEGAAPIEVKADVSQPLNAEKHEEAHSSWDTYFEVQFDMDSDQKKYFDDEYPLAALNMVDIENLIEWQSQLVAAPLNNGPWTVFRLLYISDAMFRKVRKTASMNDIIAACRKHTVLRLLVHRGSYVKTYKFRKLEDHEKRDRISRKDPK